MSNSIRLFLITACVLAACYGYRYDGGNAPTARTINEDPNPLVYCVPGHERPVDTRLAATAPGE